MNNIREVFLLIFVIIGLSCVNMHAELTIDPMLFVIHHETFFTDPDLASLYEKMVNDIYNGSLSGPEIQNAIYLAREKAEELYMQNKNNKLMAIILSLYSLELFMR